MVEYDFKLNGTSIKSYVLADSKVVLKRNSGDDDTAEIRVSEKILDTITPQVGQSIEVWKGETTADVRRFKGIVKIIDEDNGYIILTCKNPYHQLKYKLISQSFDKNVDDEAGEVSAIYETIVSDGGINVSVESSGTGTTDIVLDKYVCNKETRFERAETLATVLNWTSKYDYVNDQQRLEPKGYYEYPTTLTVGGNVTNTPRWNINLEQMRNVITVEGAVELDTRTESETGDGSTTTYYFNYTPESTDLTVAGTLQQKGVLGADITFDYSVDRQLRSYTFESGSIPAMSAAIEMKYTTYLPRPVTGENSESIAKYGITQEEVFKFDDIVTVDDAERRVDQLLNILKDGEVTTSLITNLINIHPGYKITVQDPLQSQNNGEYIVYEVVMNYPNPYETIKIGTGEFNIGELFQTINERLNNLEKTQDVVEEILRQLKKVNSSISAQTRYTQVETEDISGITHGIWGNPRFGVWGTAVWGTTARTPTVTKLIPGNNTFKEFLYDQEFNDSISNVELAYNLDSDSNVSASGIVDDSGKGNTATALNYTTNDGTDTGVVYTGGDPLGGSNVSAVFNGSSSYITYEDSFDYNTAFTFCAWIYPISKGDDHRIIQKGTNDWGVYWKTSGDTLRFQTTGLSDPTLSLASVSTYMPNDAWSHLAVVYDGSNKYIYINGVLRANEAASGTVSDLDDTVNIGNYVGATTYGLDGNLAYARIWETNLTLTQINTEMNSIYPVHSDDLKKSWSLNGDSDDTNYLVQGKVGQAFRFQQSDSQQLETPSEVNTDLEFGSSDSFSISYWVKFNTLSGNGGMIHRRLGSYGAGFFFDTTANKVRFGIEDTLGTNPTVETGTLTTDTWYHVVGVRDVINDQLHIYLNGSYVTSSTDTTTTDLYSGADKLIIGWAGVYLDGAMDSVSIIRSTLSASEISTIYNSGNGLNANPGATWNTTTKEITFDPNQILQTKQISLGPIYTSFIVSCANPTGTFIYEISGDNGTTWQTVTLDVLTNFTLCDGTGVLFRVKENANTTGSLINTYTSGGSYDNAAIKIILEE